MIKITLEAAKTLIHAAEMRARELGIAEVIVIVDEGGNLVAVHRMDDAWLASIDIALNKAWTSVALKVATEYLAPLVVPNGELYGLNTTNNGRIVVFGGGIPLEFEGKVIGAVGASGSTVQNDIEVAEAAVRAFGTYPKARIGASRSLL
ncbi:heme-binding protein [Paenibacillaceae bacterium]|nr:heme-binding protein [Paenibacillaceae bacterium]